MPKRHCAYHPEREADHQCRRCGRMLCDECYDSEAGGCKFADCAGAGMRNGSDPRYGDGRERRPERPSGPSSNPGCQIAISILAIIGGLFLLLLAICGGMLFLNY